MSNNDLVWVAIGWRTQAQVDTLNAITAMPPHERDILYSGLCDRVERGDPTADRVIRNLLAEPLLAEELKAPLAIAYQQACNPRDLPYGTLKKDKEGNVKITLFQRGSDGSFEPV